MDSVGASESGNVLILRGERDLAMALRRARRGVKVVVAIDGMVQSERALWEARINRLTRACGCELGAISTLLAATSYTGCALAVRQVTATHWINRIGIGLVVVLAAAILGKVIGLGYARIQLAATLVELRRRAAHL